MIYHHAKHNNLNIVFTDRLGGYSPNTKQGDYSSLNLGFHVGDAPEMVSRNYIEVLGQLGIQNRKTAIAKQVHGIGISRSSVIARDITDFVWDRASEADIIELDNREDVVVMLFADCLPLILSDGKKVISVHVGWKGLVSDIVSIALGQFDDKCDITGLIGPGIDSCCYEVNREIAGRVRGLFPEQGDISDIIIGSDDKYHLSIKSAVRMQLNNAGVGNIIMASPCTGCDSRFYSHRKSSQQGKVTGRQASIVFWD